MRKFIDSDDLDAITSYEVIENEEGKKEILINFLNKKKQLRNYTNEEELKILKIQLVHLISAVHYYKENERTKDIVTTIFLSIGCIGLYLVTVCNIINKNYQAGILGIDMFFSVLTFIILKETIRRLRQYNKYRIYLHNCDLFGQSKELVKNAYGLEVPEINANNIDNISTKEIKKKIKKIKKENQIKSR